MAEKKWQVTTAGEKLLKDFPERGKQQIKQQQKLPPVEEWDYQTAEVGPRGEELPAGAQTWKPDGKPYFGQGLTGKLKEYWWNFTKDVPNVASVEEMADLWNKRASQAGRWQQGGTETETQSQASSQIQKNIADAFSGRGAEQTEEQKKRSVELAVKQKKGTLTPEEQAELKELGKGAIDESALSGVRRAVNVGVTAGLDLFSYPAQALEQAIGAYRAGAETLQEQAGGENITEEQARARSKKRADYQAAVKAGQINPHLNPPSTS